MTDELVPEPTVERLSNLVRIEQFSDGVIGVGMTLLAFNLSIEEYSKGHFGSNLVSQWPTYLAFAASFLYVAVMWINHHAAFDRLAAASLKLKWANMGVLFGAVALSFPTAVLAAAFQRGNASDERAAVLIYAGFATVMGLSWNFFFSVIGHDPSLWKDPTDGAKWKKVTRWAYLGTVGYLLAGLLGWLVSPLLALLGFLLLVLYRSTQASRIAS